MSWDGYVQHMLVELPQGGTLSGCAILGQDGGLWAQSEGFPAVTPEQVAGWMAGFASMEDKGHAGDLGSSGIVLGEIKYQVVPSPGDATVLRGKSKEGGCTIKKTNTALVVGTYEQPVRPGDCNVMVENMGEYLVGQGY